MAITRKLAYQALFTRLQEVVTTCKAFSRRWVAAQEAGRDLQPMLLCLDANEAPRDDPPLPPVWTLTADVVIYVPTNDTDTPGDLLSDIIDQVEAALEPQGADGVGMTRAHTTLAVAGIQRAWISGEVEKEDGALTGGQGWIAFQISMRVAQ